MGANMGGRSRLAHSAYVRAPCAFWCFVSTLDVFPCRCAHDSHTWMACGSTMLPHISHHTDCSDIRILHNIREGAARA